MSESVLQPAPVSTRRRGRREAKSASEVEAQIHAPVIDRTATMLPSSETRMR
jgi:hypothetical protein